MTGPPESVIEHLAAAGQWERVLAQARERLAQDPRDETGHLYCARALLSMKRADEARAHISELLQINPGEPYHHYLAASYALFHKGWWQDAENSIHTALELDPGNYEYHRVAGYTALVAERLEEARWHAEAARRLAPNDPDVASLCVAVASAGETGSSAAWSRVHKLERALRHEPQDFSLHYQLGLVYLQSLEKPDLAAGHFRSALMADPHDEDAQRGWLAARARKNYVFQLLNLPRLIYDRVQERWASTRFSFRKKWLWLLASPLLLLPMIWLTLALVLIGPAGKGWEWFILADEQARLAKSEGSRRFWQRIHGLPMFVRVLLLLTGTAALWILAASVVKNGFWKALNIFCWFALSYVLLAPLILWGLRWWSDRAQRRRGHVLLRDAKAWEEVR